MYCMLRIELINLAAIGLCEGFPAHLFDKDLMTQAKDLSHLLSVEVLIFGCYNVNHRVLQVKAGRCCICLAPGHLSAWQQKVRWSGFEVVRVRVLPCGNYLGCPYSMPKICFWVIPGQTPASPLARKPRSRFKAQPIRAGASGCNLQALSVTG